MGKLAKQIKQQNTNTIMTTPMIISSFLVYSPQVLYLWLLLLASVSLCWLVFVYITIPLIRENHQGHRVHQLLNYAHPISGKLLKTCS